MHHLLLAKGLKGILLKENQSTNKTYTAFYFFVIAVAVVLLLFLTAGDGGESGPRKSKSDIARRYCIDRSSFSQS
jgi:hypothetical protein